MNSVRNLLGNQQLLTVHVRDSALEVARRMTKWNVGAVLVMDGDRLAGIFSERDLMTRVINQGLAPGETSIAQVMTADPVVIDSEATAEQGLRLMNQAKCRHLPVMSEGRPVGMLSIRDLLLHDIRQKDNEIEMMRAFIHDVPPSTPGGSGPR